MLIAYVSKFSGKPGFGPFEQLALVEADVRKFELLEKENTEHRADEAARQARCSQDTSRAGRHRIFLCSSDDEYRGRTQSERRAARRALVIPKDFTCSACGVVKLESRRWVVVSAADGYVAMCKSCHMREKSDQKFREQGGDR